MLYESTPLNNTVVEKGALDCQRLQRPVSKDFGVVDQQFPLALGKFQPKKSSGFNFKDMKYGLTYLGQTEWLFANSGERKRLEKTERKSSKIIE